MKVLFALSGSTGDVAPFTGIGALLKARGHDVVLASLEDVTHVVTDAGLTCAPLPGRARSVQDVTLRPGPFGQLQLLRWLAKNGSSGVPAVAEALRPLIADADAVVFTPLTVFARPIAEHFGVPNVGVHLQPLQPSADYPPSALPVPSLGRLGNRLLGEAFIDTASRSFWPQVQQMRADLGMAPAPSPRRYRLGAMRAGWPLLQAYSRFVVPPPADNPPNVRTIGYCWPAARQEWTPPAELSGFLASGPPPLVATFGSAPVGDAQAVRAAVTRAARRAGLRLVIQAGWAGLGDPGPVDDDVFIAGHVPHDWLFEHAGVVAHACGAGTTAAVVRAGVPHVPVPVMMDQPFWARRLHALGVAPRPIPITSLDERHLTQALRAVVRDRGFADTARGLAAAVATEDGNGRAADAIEALPTR